MNKPNTETLVPCKGFEEGQDLNAHDIVRKDSYSAITNFSFWFQRHWAGHGRKNVFTFFLKEKNLALPLNPSGLVPTATPPLLFLIQHIFFWLLTFFFFRILTSGWHILPTCRKCRVTFVLFSFFFFWKTMLHSFPDEITRVPLRTYFAPPLFSPLVFCCKLPVCLISRQSLSFLCGLKPWVACIGTLWRSRALQWPQQWVSTGGLSVSVPPPGRVWGKLQGC